MPLVHIHVIENTRTPEQASSPRGCSAGRDARALRSTGPRPLPDHLRAQAGANHCRGHIGLGFERTDDIVVVQVAQHGRSREQKKAMYRALADHLHAETGLAPTDVIVSASRDSSLLIPALSSIGTAIRQVSTHSRHNRSRAKEARCSRNARLSVTSIPVGSAHSRKYLDTRAVPSPCPRTSFDAQAVLAGSRSCPPTRTTPGTPPGRATRRTRDTPGPREPRAQMPRPDDPSRVD